MRQAQALQAVLLSCQAQIQVNASQIAAADFGPEHVHQLRVGLRRLRSGLRLFDDLETFAPYLDPSSELTGLSESAATFFRLLGVARDGDVLAGLWAPAVQDALQAAGLQQAPTPAAGPPAQASAAEIVRAAPQQALLVDLTRMIERLEQAAQHQKGKSAPLRPLLQRRLRRWHRKIRSAAASFAELDVDGRHQLRKRLKRFRYGMEFYSELFAAQHLKAGLKPVRQAQQVLGELNDLALALTASRAALAENQQAWFALGWLSAKQQQLLDSALPVMQRLAKASLPWKT